MSSASLACFLFMSKYFSATRLNIETASRDDGDKKRRTQQVDNPVVVASEKSDEVSEEKHEGAVDDAVVEVLSRGLKVEERVELFVGVIS